MEDFQDSVLHAGGGRTAPADEAGRCHSSFPPPEGLAACEHGCFGVGDYCRLLTNEEQALVGAAAARARAKGESARDLYFERLNKIFSS